MKKMTGLFSLCAVALLVAPTALAAPVLNNEDLATEGSVKFIKDTDQNKTGTINQPDETGQIPGVIELPGEGNSGKGLLRIQFVPNFKFGTKEGISAARTEMPVKLLEYNKEGSATKENIAPFVQVTDERGLDGAAAKWELTVKATPFTADVAGGTDVLANCKIILKQSTLTMDYKTSAEAGTFVTGQAANAEIITDNATSTKVLGTALNKSTNGFQASNVFYDGYQKDKTYTESTTSGVTFIKEAGQAPIENAEYKSTLKWTLSDAL
ncbi:WxL domain-containing protein [Vagococcus sp. BWB3-3]|uniref:WxL domain-containing protein n=1 Tax=Vagococcus allomyrinae TaxID=2794353 RepID=A0A940P487_9ENTE|nr:WxL domain-containing protein [Vagococcus allomyrinae]MBP1039421.1 WxL domain-containing protein [Vagococcus allomyrinae]